MKWSSWCCLISLLTVIVSPSSRSKFSGFILALEGISRQWNSFKNYEKEVLLPWFKPLGKYSDMDENLHDIIYLRDAFLLYIRQLCTYICQEKLAVVLLSDKSSVHVLIFFSKGICFCFFFSISMLLVKLNISVCSQLLMSQSDILLLFF